MFTTHKGGPGLNARRGQAQWQSACEDVAVDGTAVIESTAEGQDGDFYTMTQRAMGLAE